jgi:flagellar biosynthesis/type III secretory pathway chaperone
MSETQGRFLSLLKQETSLLAELHDVLLKELDALKERNSDLITEISKEKTLMLDKLGMFDNQRQLYIESEEHDFEINHETTSFSNEVKLLNNEIQESLNKCKQQNKINGGVIEISQLFNEKILDIYYGNADKQTTYSAEGRNRSNINQHSLARV